jgi:hypothetical protein
VVIIGGKIVAGLKGLFLVESTEILVRFTFWVRFENGIARLSKRSRLVLAFSEISGAVFIDDNWVTEDWVKEF